MVRASGWIRPWTAVSVALAVVVVGGIAATVVANAAETDGVVTTIASQQDGWCLDGGSARSSEGTPVRQRRCRSAAAQSWRIVASKAGGYTVISEATGRCLDVSGGSVDNGAAFITWRCHGGPNQRVELRPAGDAGDQRTVEIVALHSGGCVTAAGVNGAATQADCVTGAAAVKAGQVWRLSTAPAGAPGTGGPGADPTPTAPTGTPAPGGAMATVDYPASNGPLTNPERGFMHYADCGTDALLAATLGQYRAEGVSQVFCMIYLRSFRSRDLDAATLQFIQRQFDTIRAAGMKTVVRFAYTDSEAGDDAAPSQVLRHIAQLKPYLRANADVIAVVQAGLVGAWGEWYYTANFGNAGQMSATDRANRKAVVDALLDALPDTRMLQLRTPTFKRAIYGPQALTAGQAHNGTPAARVGHHNDCFLASADDLGTYADPATERPYLQTETNYLPMGGETCAVNVPRTQCPTALNELAQFHWSYLNADYQPDVLNGWRTGGCLPEIQRRLGYRFTLTQGSFTTTTTRGGGLQVRLGIRNDGWAAPYNPRQVQLVVRAATGNVLRRIPLTADPRTWQPGTTTTVDQTVTLPADLPAGSYHLFLALPDAAPTLAGRPEYAIQTANQGLWDATAGTNDLRTTVTITG